MRSKQYKDITGKKYGNLTVLEYTKTIDKRPHWKCLCDCGNIVEKRGKELKAGLIKSCGCLKIERGPDKDISGQKFNYLNVVECVGKRKTQYLWKCLCDCNNTIELPHYKIVSGHTKSCGCLHSKLAKENALKRNKIMVGKNHPRWRFDLTDEDRIENSNRCYNPKLYRWRNKVYKRDNYTCKKCGDSKGGNLISHHIYSWNSHTKLRFIADNGVTLCENCHKKFHNKYGFGNNTKKQYKEWIKPI
jgi:hypothetical protein